MLQRTQTEWAPAIKPSEAFSSASHRAEAMTASLGDSSGLNESAPTQLAAKSSPGDFTAMTLSPAAPAGISYADTAVTALGFIGLWLMLVGVALLARRLRLVRIDSQTTISEAAWQRQLRTAARQTTV